MALSELQQIAEAKKAAAAGLSMYAWLESTWSDVYEARQHADILIECLEEYLHANRDMGDVIQVRMRRETAERIVWLGSLVCTALSDLDDRTIARINQTACDEPTVAAPATRGESKPALQASPPSDAGLALIRHIDVLGEAEDRLLILSRMADGIADRNESSAFSRAIGDVQGLVSSVRNALNAKHEGRSA